ncbi:uncharacterized protein TNCV_1275771 [Trichonephila clavipes]|nr:uncharacterized protein TNCV_1275771 [Trichonephila clavipes]
MLLEPHTAYPIPAGTHYILLTVQKTVFGLDIIPETILPQLIENGFKPGNFRKMKRNDQKAYKLPPPTPAHPPEKIPELTTPVPPVLIPATPELTTPVFQPPVTVPDPPAHIQDPPVQLLLPDPPHLPMQIQLPDPPIQLTPVFETLKLTLTDDSSMNQIMSVLFGD